MPAAHIHGFHLNAMGQGAQSVWRWDPAEPNADAGIIAWAEAGAAPDLHSFAVDRSGETVRLIWEVGSQSFGIDLEDGAFYTPNHYDWPSDTTRPAHFDATGCWESDQHGRPFDLNDLLAGY